MHKFPMISMVLVCGVGGTGASEFKKMQRNIKIFMVLDCGVGAANASGAIENA